MIEHEPEFPSRPVHPNGLAATRARLYVGWTALKMLANHPTIIIGAVKTKNEEQIVDKYGIEIAAYVLKNELGTEPYEMFLVDSVEKIRDKYDIPPQIPIQELSEHIQ